MRRIMVLVLALLLALGAMGVLAEANAKAVAINRTNFPDARFRSYVKSEIDADKNGALSPAEIRAVTVIDVAGKGVASLKGVEYFTGLDTLYCYNNRLKQLDVSRNTKLNTLYCYNNRLTSLKLGRQRRLAELLCMKNPKLKTLDLAGCTEMIKIVKNELWSATRNYANYGWANRMSSFDIRTKLMNGKKVLRQYARPTRVDFTKKAVTLSKGDENLLPGGQRVKMTPANAIYPFTVSSDNAGVYYHDETLGIWVAGKAGTANVVVKCGRLKDALKVTVEE